MKRPYQQPSLDFSREARALPEIIPLRRAENVVHLKPLCPCVDCFPANSTRGFRLNVYICICLWCILRITGCHDTRNYRKRIIEFDNRLSPRYRLLALAMAVRGRQVSA